MADWRQIQARIRKAKNAPDAHAKLMELYQRTRDAMVAWELALLEEKALVTAEAVKWYTIAAQRFRRSEWKKKAEEALTRLGAELPTAGSGDVAPGDEEHPVASHDFAPQDRGEVAAQQLAPGEIPEEAAAEGAEADGETSGGAAATEVGADGLRKKRRRGRRGGRGRRRKGVANAPGLPNQAFAETSAPAPVAQRPQAPQPEAYRTESPRQQTFERPAYTPPREAPETRRPARVEAPMLQLPSERAAHGRAGDPALASRMTVLESTLRRLLSSPLHKLEQADEAPAGPGVFLLSDSDQVTSYYVEACQTLRIGLGNLARGGRAGKVTRGSSSRGGSYGESGLKAKLAEHLGISEAKVSQYLKDHCVVRWIQLDDDAPLLAHFVIALLRTPLNLD
jgi:hypothetical protein